MWLRLGIALVAAGVLLRAALYFPLALFQIDSDGVLAGLCAFRIADSQLPVFFPGGSRLSAASCYVAAGYFHLFGVGRVALAFVGLTWGLLFLVFMLLFLRQMLGERLACLGMLFAVVPPEQFMTVTYVPWGYGEIMASCAATLWLAAAWRRSGSLWQRTAFGFNVGLGVWFSLQTLMIALPAIVWIALGRRRAVFAEVWPALAAAIVGATPFWLGNALGGFSSFTNNWASQAAPNGAQVFDNAMWLFSVQIPKLLVRVPAWWSVSTWLIVGYIVVAVGFVVATRDDKAQPRARGDTVTLLGLVFVSVILFYVFSNAGSMRGWTVRYVAPLYLMVPIVCAIGLAAVWRWSRWLVVVTIAMLIVPNLLLYSLPGTTTRTELTTGLADDARLRALLASRKVQMIYGDYFWVYHINFDSREQIAGIPSYAAGDYFHYDRRLGTAPVRWAMLGGREEVERWAKVLGAQGSEVADGDLTAFIVDRPAPNASALVLSLRRLFP
jgi:hypothetical protein